MASRKEWPETVGKSFEEACEVILCNPNIKTVVRVGPETAAVHGDFDVKRVRVRVSKDNKVIITPHTGKMTPAAPLPCT